MHRDSRSRRTLRRTLVALGIVACAAAVAQPHLANAATACQIRTLPVPAGTWRSDILGGDPTGRYLIGEAAVSTETESRIVPLLWVDGRLVDFHAPYESAAYVDVNASGMILGRADDAGQSFAWLYRDGRFTQLPGLSPTTAEIPIALNRRGDAVGHVDDGVAANTERRIVLWPANRPGTVLKMPREPAQVVDIDDDGTMLGMSSGILSTSYRWRLGGPVHVLASPSGNTNIAVIAIRNGWIGGWDNDSFPVNAFAHHLRTGAANQVTGFGAPYSSNGLGDLGLFSTIAHRDGRIVNLPGLGTQTAQAPRVLADNGRAAGFANDGERVHAVVWHGC